VGRSDTSRATVLVCITCRGTSGTVGAELADATLQAAAGAADVTIQRVRCLANCSRGPSAAIRCDNSWTYVFGSLAPATDGPALIEGARLLLHSADGIMPWKGRPEPLKRGLTARVPPPDFVGEES
jgi:predicted metal-binding protein